MRLVSARLFSSSLPLLFTHIFPTRAFTSLPPFGISRFAANMEENGGRAMLSAEELRRKRLAALSGIPTTNTGATSSSRSLPTLASARNGAEVVDLCDSSDEDEKPAAASKYMNVDSDSDDDDAALLQQFYQEKKKQAKDNVENEHPSKKQKSSVAKNSGTASKKPKTGAKKKVASTSRSASSNGASTQFQVATWNIWFGASNLSAGEPHGSARMKALARHLLRQQDAAQNPLWAIGFQEVIDELAIHLFPLLERAGYQIFRQEGAPYGCAIALYTKGNNACTLLDVSWQPYSQTQMFRGFLYARFQLPFSGKQVLFTTTHLESFISTEQTGSQQRVHQLKELEAFCNDQLRTYSSLKTAIITGDLNWDDERPRNGVTTDPVMANVLATRWDDSFLVTRTNRRDRGCTYDPKVNPMWPKGGNLRRRFDRCLVRNTSTEGTAEATGTKLVGTEALVSLTWEKYNSYTKATTEVPTAPSDHFGLIVQMTTT